LIQTVLLLLEKLILQTILWGYEKISVT